MCLPRTGLLRVVGDLVSVSKFRKELFLVHLPGSPGHAVEKGGELGAESEPEEPRSPLETLRAITFPDVTPGTPEAD